MWNLYLGGRKLQESREKGVKNRVAKHNAEWLVWFSARIEEMEIPSTLLVKTEIKGAFWRQYKTNLKFTHFEIVDGIQMVQDMV